MGTVGTVSVAAGRGGARVGITVGITVGTTVGITEGVGVDSARAAIVGAGVAGRVTGGAVEVDCSVSIPAGVASSPPHAVSIRIITAATGSNLAWKFLTCIPTLPLPPVPTEPVSFPSSISD